MAVNLKTKTVMVFDIIEQKPVCDIRLHCESSDLQNFTIASIWRNKNYDFAPLRIEDQGVTVLQFEIGQQVQIDEILSQELQFNTHFGSTKLEFTVL